MTLCSRKEQIGFLLLEILLLIAKRSCFSCFRWFLLALGMLAATAPLSAADRPNVIIILADDFGYGDAKCFNPAAKIPTPNIDRLAAEGMKFTDAHSGSAVCTRLYPQPIRSAHRPLRLAYQTSRGRPLPA